MLIALPPADSGTQTITAGKLLYDNSGDSAEIKGFRQTDRHAYFL
jgi:hypothetical protein